MLVYMTYQSSVSVALELVMCIFRIRTMYPFLSYFSRCHLLYGSFLVSLGSRPVISTTSTTTVSGMHIARHNAPGNAPGALWRAVIGLEHLPAVYDLVS